MKSLAKVNRDDADNAIAKTGLIKPSNSMENIFCELLLEGKTSEQICEEAGLSMETASAWGTKFRAYVYGEVIKNKDAFKADGILKATQRLKQKEDDPDERDYYDYLKLRADMLKQESKENAPTGALIIVVDDDNKTVDVSGNEVRIHGTTKEIIDATRTDNNESAPAPETGTGKQGENCTGVSGDSGRKDNGGGDMVAEQNTGEQVPRQLLNPVPDLQNTAPVNPDEVLRDNREPDKDRKVQQG